VVKIFTRPRRRCTRFGSSISKEDAPRAVIAKIEMGVRCVGDYELVTLCCVLEMTADYLIRDAPYKMRAIFANSGK
jgi:hypothetical protein